MNIIKKLYALIFQKDLVWLQDYDGEKTLTIKKQSNFEYPIAKRYWPYNFKIVILLPDGETIGCSYVKRWTAYK